MVGQLKRVVVLALALVACGAPSTREAVRVQTVAQEDLLGAMEATVAHPSSTTLATVTTTTVALAEGRSAPLPPTEEARPSPTTTTTTTTAPPPSPPPPPGSGRFTIASGDDFDRLAACESMGDVNSKDGLTIWPGALSQRTTPKGRYRGAFQYDVGTAEEAGFQGDPAGTSYAEQKRLTVAFQARVGWGRWPHCRRVLGLR